LTLHINESEVRQLLTMPMAVAAVEDISRKQGEGSVIVHPRRRFELSGSGFFHHMAALDREAGFVATKQYTYVKGKLRFLVSLFDTNTGELLALIEADFMGQQRTGAASGVATKYLAKKTARIAGIIGTGGQAKTQLEAINTVRLLESAYVFGRDPQRRFRYCEEMAERLGIPVYPAESASAVVRNAEVLSTATASSHPVFEGKDLPVGLHINAIGANHAHKRELDDVAIAKANLIYVDSIAQSKQEAGDLIIPFQQQPQEWEKVHELAELVAGKAPGRTSDAQITLFKSSGIAAWDLAVAIQVYSLAKGKNLGRELAFYSSVG
jgi:ornithine cyclodeaminase/alanine dehydrogenase-like protein (mu-crystallin family)